MNREITGHREKEEENREVSEHHYDVDRENLTDLSSEQLEKVQKIRIVGNFKLIFLYTGTVTVSTVENIELCFFFFFLFLLLKSFDLVERKILFAAVGIVVGHFYHLDFPRAVIPQAVVEFISVSPICKR